MSLRDEMAELLRSMLHVHRYSGAFSKFEIEVAEALIDRHESRLKTPAKPAPPPLVFVLLKSRSDGSSGTNLTFFEAEESHIRALIRCAGGAHTVAGIHCGGEMFMLNVMERSAVAGSQNSVSRTAPSHAG